VSASLSAFWLASLMTAQHSQARDQLLGAGMINGFFASANVSPFANGFAI